MSFLLIAIPFAIFAAGFGYALIRSLMEVERHDWLLLGVLAVPVVIGMLLQATSSTPVGTAAALSAASSPPSTERYLDR